LVSIFSLLGILVHHKPSKKITNLSFFIVSLSFFLFSFHVHEKTILVPFIAYLLNIKHLRNILPSFSMMALFSLYPLLKRENQVITYFILMLLTIIYTNSQMGKSYLKALNILNVIFIVCYHAAEMTIQPPANYPWLYPMINAFLSFTNFSFILLYSYYIMWNKLKLKK
jgi:alpha-1,3-glucosyltransferase